MRTTIYLALLIAAGCASAPETPSAPAAAQSATAGQTTAQTATAQTAPAGQASQTQAPTAKKASGGGGVANKDGKVCRTESVTNTRLKTKKVCLTQEEWMAREEAAKDAFRETAKSPRHPRLDSGG
jgi:hypothetical protein